MTLGPPRSLGHQAAMKQQKRSSTSRMDQEKSLLNDKFCSPQEREQFTFTVDMKWVSTGPVQSQITLVITGDAERLLLLSELADEHVHEALRCSVWLSCPSVGVLFTMNFLSVQNLRGSSGEYSGHLLLFQVVGIIINRHWKADLSSQRPKLLSFSVLQSLMNNFSLVSPFRSFRLSLERRSQGRGSACRAGVAVPPWMKSSLPGTPSPD